MRTVITPEEALAALQNIRDLLYVYREYDDVFILDPDNNWTVGTLDLVGEVLHQIGIAPVDEVQPYVELSYPPPTIPPTPPDTIP